MSDLTTLAGRGLIDTVSKIEAGTVKLVLAYNAMVDRYEAEHELRIREQASNRLLREELAKFKEAK